MQAHAQGYDVALVTGDKDFFQLVQDGIRVFNPKEDGTWYDESGVVEKFGVRPDQVVDVLALMGDSVDNIRASGIGEGARPDQRMARSTPARRGAACRSAIGRPAGACGRCACRW
jgi:hypothetical protein